MFFTEINKSALFPFSFKIYGFDDFYLVSLFIKTLVSMAKIESMSSEDLQSNLNFEN